MKYKILSIALLLAVTSSVFAQTIPVGSLENIEDAYRRQQLLGNDTSNSSFMIRPVFINKNNQFDLDSEEKFGVHDFRTSLYQSKSEQIQLYALPIVWQQQFNSHHPYGWNDGAMVPNKGYETMISAGFFAKLGFVSVQFKPEYVFAQNKDFRQVTEIPEAASFKDIYTLYYNSIDEPARFGDGSYSKFNWGQSSIRINYGPISAGLSNENLMVGTWSKEFLINEQQCFWV
jgi:hypothetical protein